MSNNSEWPAYPILDDSGNGLFLRHPGMTMRQYYKAAALQGLLASGPHDCSWREITQDAALYADAMLEEDAGHGEQQ